MRSTWVYEATNLTTRAVLSGEVEATDLLNAVYLAGHVLPKGTGDSIRARPKPADADGEG